MGSNSDWDVMQHACTILKEFGVSFEAKVLSAHRMPDEMFAYAESARERGLEAIIAGAGGAAHLPGMLASKTVIPVLGVPIPSKYLRGEDSLLSIVQMPRGVPVATFAIGEAGAVERGAVRDRDARDRRRRPRDEARPVPRHADGEGAQHDPAALSAQGRGMGGAAIPPGSWLGLLGGGQLGRMFCMAAQSLGYKVCVLDPGSDSPAGAVADDHIARGLPRPDRTGGTRRALPRRDDRVRERPGRARSSSSPSTATSARKPRASRSRRTASPRSASSRRAASTSRRTR